MSTIELKNRILDKLQVVNDHVLRDVLNLLEFETNSEKFKITDEEKLAINTGLQQIENGQTIKHADVVNEVNLWLQSK